MLLGLIFESLFSIGVIMLRLISCLLLFVSIGTSASALIGSISTQTLAGGGVQFEIDTHGWALDPDEDNPYRFTHYNVDIFNYDPPIQMASHIGWITPNQYAPGTRVAIIAWCKCLSLIHI